MSQVRLIDLPPILEGLHWDGLSGSSSALCLAQLIENLPKPVVLVCGRDFDAQQMVTDIRFFLSLMGSSQKISFYPSRVTDIDPTNIGEETKSWQRLSSLHHLLEYPKQTLVVTSVMALGQKTIPKSTLLKHTDLLAKGSKIDRDEFAKRLTASGYEKESVVEEPGTFALRGGVIDFFPPHLKLPVRMDLIGDEIETLRHFDPVTQRSLTTIEDVSWVPAREILFEKEAAPSLRQGLKDLADSRDLPPSSRSAIEDAFEEGRYLPQMESLFPLFYPEPSTFFDYVQPEAKWIAFDPFFLDRQYEQLATDFKRLREEFERRQILSFTPDELSLSPKQLKEEIQKRVQYQVSDVKLTTTSPGENHTFKVQLLDELRRELIEKKKKEQPLAPLTLAWDEWKSAGLRTLFIAHDEVSAKRMHDMLSNRIPHLHLASKIEPSLLENALESPPVLVGNLSSGFRSNDWQLVIVTEHELFRERKHSATLEVSREDLISSISELKIGDGVVHVDFGVGIFRGLERITAAGVANDYLQLEYAGGDKLYLPIYRLNKIQKYTGADAGAPKMDRLGNASAWEKTKKKAEKAVAEMAQELVQLYATRKVAKGFSFGKPDEGYMAFEADFPYEETRDQLRTLEEVSEDLESEKPMDRLVCGDVGFGKTEIALRTAFRVAMEGKQVAVLVPTTILAQQHYETFVARMKNHPIRVEFLSRFKGAHEQKEVIEKLKNGDIDIVVGTHRLLSKDIAFKDLGLLIIDEEHRFGVQHKERIKQFRNNVHVMTLTATPIPRTLQMSMAGIRDLSVINTPPLDRKAIQTYLCKFDEAVIVGAIRKELSRHGQIYFVHNKVENIHNMGAYIQKLVPEARIGIGHGQMNEEQLEETMHKFIRKEFDILLCTTIIESGLDIPLANTMIINRADQFGLAQLYQLRGRVGRSEREAFAYLLIPGEELITKDALKRLKVLKRFTELGSGLKIALHDLEIRGAGNLLGAAQKGHIAAVGLELYTQLLDREVRRLKGEQIKEEIEPEIQCQFPAYLPEDYVASTGERLLTYKKLSSAKTDAELQKLKEEIRDRFGPYPPTVENLFEVIELKILARRLGIKSLRLSKQNPMVEFTDQANVNIDQLLKMVKKDKHLKLRPDNKLIVEISDSNDAFKDLKMVLSQL